MLDSVRIFPYNPNSESARDLSQMMTMDTRLGRVPRIKREGSNFKGGKSFTVINWGSSEALPASCLKGRVINHHEAVSRATNKLTFFQSVSRLTDPPRCPPWTTSKAEVAGWLADGRTAFARTVLNGHSGAGIVDVSEVGQLDSIRDGTLFTQYVPKKEEWRIHVAFGRAFEIQRKAYRNNDAALEGFTPNWRIRNHGNGFVFERNFNQPPHRDIVDQAIKAVTGLGLDFGAVDVIFNRKRSEAYVLEINTAPGIEGSTVNSYSDMFITNILEASNGNN